MLPRRIPGPVRATGVVTPQRRAERRNERCGPLGRGPEQRRRRWMLDTRGTSFNTKHATREGGNNNPRQGVATRLAQAAVPLASVALARAATSRSRLLSQPMPQAGTIGASDHLGGRPMRLRCHAFPCKLQALASSASDLQCPAFSQPSILLMWVSSCHARHNSSFLAHCPRSVRASKITDHPRSCIPEGSIVPAPQTLLPKLA